MARSVFPRIVYNIRVDISNHNRCINSNLQFYKFE